MPRTPPERTADQQRVHDRIAALREGTVEAVRAWAAKYGVTLFGDDELVLLSIHEARIDEPRMLPRLRAASRRWVKANKERIVKTHA